MMRGFGRWSVVLMMILVLFGPLPMLVWADPGLNDMRSLCREMVTLVIPIIQDRDLSIQNQVPDKVGLPKAEKERFCELLTNILLNAANASPAKGRLQILYHERERLLEVMVPDPTARFDTQHSVKDLRGNTIKIESKAGQGVRYTTTI